MGGRWLVSRLKNAVNKIRFLLIFFLEEIIKKISVKRRAPVSLNDRHRYLGGGFVDDPDDDVDDNINMEDDVVVDVEDDIDIEDDDDVDMEEEDINERAKKFIADFYEHLRIERQFDLERQRLVDFYENLRLERQLDLERLRH